MLDSMRQASSGWVAKILLGLLVISFAVWGVSEQFFGYRGDVVAQVGDREITAQAFDLALRQRMQTIGQQTGRAVTLEQARAFGLPEQVLNTMIAEAAIENQGDQLNLGVSDDTLANELAQDPIFAGPSGRFDATRFQALLRNAGLTEETFFRDLEGGLVRDQIVSAVAGGVTAPQPLLEAIYQFQTETRNFSYLLLDEGSIDPIPDPEEEALRTYFSQNKDSFIAPEYRKVGLLTISPTTVADPDAVTEDDARDYFEDFKADFVEPEERQVLQLRYPSETEQAKAVELLSSGSSFDDLLEARGMTRSDVDLGLRGKDSIVDEAIADAAFSANVDEPVSVPDARFGPAIVMVTEINTRAASAFEDVEDQVRQALAARNSEDTVLSFYDEIEDERAAGSTLQEIANNLNLSYEVLEPFSQTGTIETGRANEFPGRPFLVADAFESDVGVENDPLRVDDSHYIFYEVLETIPSRERTFEEARDEVLTSWRQDETSNRIADQAAGFVDRIRNGESLSTVAQELGQSVFTREGVTRNASNTGVSENAIAQVFNGPRGHVANADADRPPAQYVIQVDDIIVPAYFAEAQDSQAIKAQLDRMMQADLMGAYTANLLEQNSPFVNNTVFQIVTGERVIEHNNAGRTLY